MKAVLLLLVSNVFMTFAWYGHLKFKGTSLALVILASWLIALPEYCFQVPANRIGHTEYRFTAAQLKILQEVITLLVFVVFSTLYLHEPPRWNELLGMALIGVAVFVTYALNPRPAAASRAGDDARSLPAAAAPADRSVADR